MPHPDADLVVLGAGPAGLGAALWAARAGHRVVVLEREERVGGAAASHEVAGIRVDLGSHRLHPATDPAILAELRALLGPDLQQRRRNGRIRLEGRWVAFPPRTGDLLRSLPPGFALAAARDAATGWARRAAPARGGPEARQAQRARSAQQGSRGAPEAREDTFAEVVRARLGPTMLHRFYGPYARKLWGLPPEELSGEQARRRVSANSPGKLLARLVRRPGTDQGTFWYPRRGFGAIAEALAGAAATAGADLRLGVPATGIELGADHVEVATATGPVRGGRLWSTLPLGLLARLAGAAPEVLEAGASLATRAMLLVYLVLDTDRYTEFDAHYLPGPETPVTRVSEPKNYRDGDDPSGRTVLCAELPCGMDDDVWRASDEELGELVARGLVAVGLPPVRPVAVEVRRLPHAYPIYRRGFEAAFATLDTWASSQPRLLTFGRQGLYAHDNSHHALAMARAATAALRPGGGFDDAAWATAREAFTHHVVED